MDNVCTNVHAVELLDSWCLHRHLYDMRILSSLKIHNNRTCLSLILHVHSHCNVLTSYMYTHAFPVYMCTIITLITLWHFPSFLPLGAHVHLVKFIKNPINWSQNKLDQILKNQPLHAKIFWADSIFWWPWTIVHGWKGKFGRFWR